MSHWLYKRNKRLFSQVHVRLTPLDALKQLASSSLHMKRMQEQQKGVTRCSFPGALQLLFLHITGWYDGEIAQGKATNNQQHRAMMDEASSTQAHHTRLRVNQGNWCVPHPNGMKKKVPPYFITIFLLLFSVVCVPLRRPPLPAPGSWPPTLTWEAGSAWGFLPPVLVYHCHRSARSHSELLVAAWKRGVDLLDM